MALFPLSALLGLLAGWATGGRLGRLSRFRLRATRLVIVALAIEVSLGVASTRYHVPAYGRVPLVLASDLLVGTWIVLNAWHRSRPQRLGWGATGAGWIANFVPMAVYGGMPVSATALRLAGLSGIDVARGHLGKHVLAWHAATAATPWLALSDWIPVRPLGTVVSPGDLLMAAGIAALLALAMSERARATPETGLAAPDRDDVAAPPGDEKNGSAAPLGA